MEFPWLQSAQSIPKQALNMCNVITFELGHLQYYVYVSLISH